MAHDTAGITVEDPHAGHGDGHGHGHEDLMLEGYDGQMHPANLQHYFVSAEQQFEASKLGMWLFLMTEILLFGGMFVAYAIFRAWYPEVYAEASTQLDTVLGAGNTLILLASSLSMAWAIRAAQMDNRKLLVTLLWVTVGLAAAFLVIKYFEYTHKFDLGIFAGAYFVYPEGEILEMCRAVAANALPAAEIAEMKATLYHSAGGHCLTEPRMGIFFSIYYMMTGIHATHILIGIVAISVLAVKAQRGRYTSVWYTPVENVGLYWHIVDIIWIFVFPLMYLI